jgi:hypothetical protein
LVQLTHIEDDQKRTALITLRTDQRRLARSCLKILTKDATMRSLGANRAQEVLETDRQAQLDDRGYVRQLILKGRQLGASTWVGGICYGGTKLHLGRKGMVIADKKERAGALFDMYERFEREAPELIARPTETVQHRLELAWKGDSSLKVATANDKEAGRAETIWYVHCSEFAFWDYALEVLRGLGQAVPPRRGEMYIESTANGIGNPFHAMWEAALAHDNEWHAIFLPWWIGEEYIWPVDDTRRAEIESSSDEWERKAMDVGFYWAEDTGGDDDYHKLSVEQIEFRRRKIADDFQGDEQHWRQDYPSTPEEAFIATGGAFFDQDALADLFTATRTIKPMRRSITARKLQKADNGSLRIWELPDPFGHYVIGADTATGKEVGNTEDESGGLDFSVADVIKVAQWEQDEHSGMWRIIPCRIQVAQFHGRMPPEVFAPGCYLLGQLWSCRASMERSDQREFALLAPERNHSSGQTTIRILRDMGYPNLFRHRMKNTIGDARPTVNFGFLTDAGSRQMILDTMAAHVRNGTSGIQSQETVREMRTFIWAAGKPQAVEGSHDDRIMSYAIAIEMERWHRHNMPTGDHRPPIRNTPTGR